VFKFGASGILLSRKEIQGESERTETVEPEDNEYDEGTAFILTAGTRLTLPITLLPTFAATFHNFSRQSFSEETGSAGAPDAIKPTVDLGFSITPQLANYIRVHFEVNWKDFAQEYENVSTNRRLVAGMEIDFARTIFFRVGYGDGFGSGGIGIRSDSLEFDLTTYAVDSSSGSSWRGREDRRFVMGLSAGI
jgi:hypothetical protein